ncbi:MAG: Wzz/FepE/Etk N-terminal domain-containing protein [Oscillospiraceae bacterium]|nr:Wzz/FepE/Etk N-terminal domain-containing protein [Oscillospiraceae bacterium]MDD4412973.1 Wzz/FepE/Etk N-terminal domain-containing protein [Oscillospiraceae bacterium]
MDIFRFDIKVVYFIINKIWIFIVSIVAGGLFALFISAFLIEPKYTSSFSLCVRNSEAEGSRISSADIYASKLMLPNCAVIIKSNTVLKTVAEKLGDGTTVEELQKYISITPIEDTSILEITVFTNDAEYSYKISKILATVAPPLTKGVMKAGIIEVLDMPSIIFKPYKRNLFLSSSIGASIGFVISIVIVFILYNIDTTINDVDELRDRYKLPLLGEVPFYDGNKDEEANEV